ncbi:hypothetical protein CALCODRAFT_485751 [Calocera cornea HHB12733]|uniref:Uncharacterized protein n=1 Tax=Calocera cornea HHB12733 TaxID=1353952 RepID=A0A165E727_9BASI|nr:hypothetical protein CALCODRAFT_485751 [Calocera cornea HHB12733]
MVLTELGINQVFGSSHPSKASKPVLADRPTACQPENPSPQDGSPAFPAHSTPRQAAMDGSRLAAHGLAGQPAGFPTQHHATAAPPDFPPQTIVPETPGAWGGASMATFDVSDDLVLDGLDASQFSHFKISFI